MHQGRAHPPPPVATGDVTVQGIADTQVNAPTMDLVEYPLPLHPHDARYILPVPLARAPTGSLLQVSNQTRSKIMAEFPDPSTRIPPSMTLLDILVHYPNHLLYEGLDPLIQIGMSAGDMITHIPEATWPVLERYKICKGQDRRNWLQKRLDARKYILGQEYIEALRTAPKIRQIGTNFSTRSKSQAPATWGVKGRKKAAETREPEESDYSDYSEEVELLPRNNKHVVTIDINEEASIALNSKKQAAPATIPKLMVFSYGKPSAQISPSDTTALIHTSPDESLLDFYFRSISAAVSDEHPFGKFPQGQF